MYESWLKPPARPNDHASPRSIASRIHGSATGNTRVGLVGLDPVTADRVRDHLYSHQWDFGDLQLADLGNLRKQTSEFIIPLLRELHNGGILPVLIGGRGRLLPAQYLAFGELNRQVGMFCIDQEIRLSAQAPETGAPGVLDGALHRDRPPVYHLAHAGSQRHLTDPALESLFFDRHYESYSLGQARANLTDLEPSIRDADLMMLDVGAVRWAEAPAQAGYNPSGFSLQEAGQLCYYAGNSDRLSSFGIYGIDPGRTGAEAQQLTAAAYAQLIWYFLHGFSRRSGDFPVSLTGMLEYVVDTKLTERLTFWRSPRTNRWWIQVPADRHTAEARNRLVACSYQDYLSTSQEGHLPDRVVRAFSRY